MARGGRQVYAGGEAKATVIKISDLRIAEIQAISDRDIAIVRISRKPGRLGSAKRGYTWALGY